MNIPSALTPSGPGKKSVLIVDDVAENREILAYYLGKAGYQTTCTHDGFMALEGLVGGAMQRRTGSPVPTFDLVLMDMQMPRVDGYEAVRTLRSKNCRIPIIAVTAHTLTGDREKCLAAGCDDYIGKPVEPEKLIAICQRLIAQASQRKVA